MLSIVPVTTIACTYKPQLFVLTFKCLAVFFWVFTESTLYPPQRDLIIRTLIIAGCDAIIKFKIRHENEFRNTLVGVASLQIYPRVKGYKEIDMIV